MAKEDTDSKLDETTANSEEEVDTSTNEVDDTTEDKAEPEAKEEETEQEESESEDNSTEEDSSTFTKRYTQFKGDTPEEYSKNLEEAYHNSSAEAVKLTREVADLKKRIDSVSAAVANDPELAEKLSNPEAVENPAVKWAESRMEQEMKADYDKFVSIHPEISTDPVIAEKMEKIIPTVVNSIYEAEGRQAPLGEAMNKAWVILGLHEEDNKDKVNMAAKDTAAMSKSTSGGKKSAPKSDFTEAQLKIAKQLGLSEEQLREHVKNN